MVRSFAHLLPLCVLTLIVAPLSAADGDSKSIQSLKGYLKIERDKRPAIASQEFAAAPISAAEAKAAQSLLWQDHLAGIRASREAEMNERKVKTGEFEMPFFYKTFGEKPKSGRSLVISMHGGGGAPKQVNDGQWENQKKLYVLEEGVYLVPRAPTNTWNLWHQDHIDILFTRLIENLIVFEDVDPDRVYIMGYSAGGDGVYQLAPRMADQLAAAAMMAGHPNEASPLGLRNLPFSLQVGGKDAAYRRNEVAKEWEAKLDDLQKHDPEGYVHFVKIYPDKGHWMDREDAVALPWMAKYTRRTFPTRIVWYQDDVTHTRFYWLAIEDNQRKTGTEVVAHRDNQAFRVETKELDHVDILLNDEMCNLDEPIVIRAGKSADKLTETTVTVPRTIGVIARTISERGDSKSVFSATVRVTIP